MLKYTGHPLVDVGAATILSYSRKHDISQLTEDDLEKMADFISEEYSIEPLRSFLTVAFPNSGFTQVAFRDQPKKREDYARRVTRSFKSDAPVLDQKCVFTGDPIVGISLGDKKSLPVGRAFKQHVPLLLGEFQINFYSGGEAGLPVSGKALLCIQALPMGCAKCGGRLLAVHSDNHRITEYFASEFLKENLRMLTLAHQQGSTKIEERYPAKTLLIDTLLRMDIECYNSKLQDRPSSLSAYHFTNSGKANPLSNYSSPLDIYHLPLEIMEFLQAVQNPEYSSKWKAVTQRAWQLAKKRRSKNGKLTSQESDGQPNRNFLYDDLFNLPQRAPYFVRLYFLRVPIRTSFGADPRRKYSAREEASLISWDLTSLFLRTVIKMNEDRIQKISELGDLLATYISDHDDKKFFNSFLQHRYDYFRLALIKVNLSHIKEGNSPLLTLDSYLDVFEEGDDLARSNWRFARDLVMIRMIEQLYRKGWIGDNPDALPEVSEEPEEAI